MELGSLDLDFWVPQEIMVRVLCPPDAQPSARTSARTTIAAGQRFYEGLIGILPPASLHFTWRQDGEVLIGVSVVTDGKEGPLALFGGIRKHADALKYVKTLL